MYPLKYFLLKKHHNWPNVWLHSKNSFQLNQGRANLKTSAVMAKIFMRQTNQKEKGVLQYYQKHVSWECAFICISEYPIWTFFCSWSRRLQTFLYHCFWLLQDFCSCWMFAPLTLMMLLSVLTLKHAVLNGNPNCQRFKVWDLNLYLENDIRLVIRLLQVVETLHLDLRLKKKVKVVKVAFFYISKM